MAASDTPIMVGRIINPSSTDAVIIFLPLTPNRSCIMGTMTIRAKNPYTTEGIPASRSTAGFTIRYTAGGQNSARNTAHSSPMGTPMSIAPAVT